MTDMTGQPSGGGDWRVGRGVDIHLESDRRPRTAQTGTSGAAFIISVLFTVLLIVAPEQLDAAYTWIRDLPIVLEVVGWVLLLPWMLAWLVWQTTWALWLRIVLVAILVAGPGLGLGRSAR